MWVCVYVCVYFILYFISKKFFYKNHYLQQDFFFVACQYYLKENDCVKRKGNDQIKRKGQFKGINILKYSEFPQKIIW